MSSSAPLSTAERIAELRRGMAQVRRQAVVAAWWEAPWDTYPPLSLERRMGREAARLLAAGERPWRVARDLGRRWPRWRFLMPELVRAVMADSRRLAGAA